METKVDGKAEAALSPVPICLDPRLHGILANPLRHEIVLRTGARPWCATEIAEATGYSRKHASKAIKELVEAGLLELVERKPGPKGRIASYYRAVYRFMLQTPEWEQLSVVEQVATTNTIVESLHRDMVHSLDTGLLYAHPHHVMLRDHRRLDDEGMERVEEIFQAAYKEAVAEEEASIERCERSGDEPFWVVYGLSSFQRGPEGPASGA